MAVKLPKNMVFFHCRFSFSIGATQDVRSACLQIRTRRPEQYRQAAPPRVGRYQGARGALAQSPPLRNCDSVAGQAVKPLTHATGDSFVALPTGRNKTPFVLLARGDTLRIACVQLGNREAFPIAEGNFGKPWLQAIAVRRQTECP